MKKPLPAPAIDDALAHAELFPIREVARQTGVNPVTLRAWERRYGLIQPTRTASGHRLYSQADIDAIGTILAWLRRGVAVSKVGSLLARTQGLANGRAQALGDAARWQGQVREAVCGFDRAALERTFDEVAVDHPEEQVFAGVFMPVWQALRDALGEYGQRSEWLFLDQFLRARALQGLQRQREPKSWRVALAPLQGESTELELLLTGLSLGGEDMAVTVLAPTQPVDELLLVCERLRPDALVLFASHRTAADLARRLARLTLGVKCPVLLAGKAADMTDDSLQGGPVVCLREEGELMGRRLRQYLAGHLDT